MILCSGLKIGWRVTNASIEVRLAIGGRMGFSSSPDRTGLS
jgi:hypothetical protein